MTSSHRSQKVRCKHVLFGSYKYIIKMVHCVAKGCNNRSSRKSKKQEKIEKIQKISFFTFPKNEIKRKARCTAMNITEACIKENSTLCSFHFQREDFYGSFETRICLKEDAIPFLDEPSTSTLCKKQCTRKLEIDDDSRPLKKSKVDSITPVLMDQIVDQIKITEQGNIDVTQSKLSISDRKVTKNMEDKSTQTPQPSFKVCKSTAVSPRRIHNSPEKVKLREDFNRTKKHYQSKIKVLKQRTRRLEKKVAKMTTIFAHLKEKNFFQEEEFYNLKGIAAGNANLLKRIIYKSKGIPLTRKFSPALRTFAITLHYYSPRAYSYVRETFDSCLPYPRSLSKWYCCVDGEPGFNKEALAYIKERVKNSNHILLGALMLDEMAIR